MAAALTPAEILAAFDHWKVPYHEVTGWKTRSNGNPWGDVTMLGFHHTADDAPDNVTRDMLVRGHSALRGPLCNFGSRDDGWVDIISAGPANHFGKGDPRVLTAVRGESYGDYPPKTTKNQESAGAIGGNSLTYGWEVYYAGPRDKEINPLQYRVTILSMAAITWALDKKSKATWTSKSTIGHKEWSNWKVDPAGVDMKVARSDIQWCLDNGPTLARDWYETGAKTATAPAPQEDDFMGNLKFETIDDFTKAVQTALLQTQVTLPSSVRNPQNPSDQHSLLHILRGLQLNAYVASTKDVDVNELGKAVAASMDLTMIVEAVRDAGAGATAEQIVDELVARLDREAKA